MSVWVASFKNVKKKITLPKNKYIYNIIVPLSFYTLLGLFSTKDITYVIKAHKIYSDFVELEASFYFGNRNSL